MRACACGERTKATCAMRGSVTSLTNWRAALRQARQVRPRHRAADIGIRPVERGEAGRQRRRRFSSLALPRAPAPPPRPHRRSPGSRCSGSNCRKDARGSPRGSARRRCSSSSCAVSSMPGVQKPHCSALRRSNAVLQVGDLAGVGDAFDGLDARAVALHREHQAAAHDRRRRPAPCRRRRRRARSRHGCR